MEWLNYHHLLYFWVVAREGSVSRAAKVLRLAQPTISGQIHRLEDVLGEKLFERKGRNLALTAEGRVAFGYADEIFALGQEFLDTVHGRSPGRPLRLVVGLSDVLPKAIVHKMLQPAFALERSVRIVCREARSTEAFAGDLAVQAVDIVLSDGPAAPGSRLRLFSHLLGECGTTFFAAPALARNLRGRFPRSLDGAPFLLPGTNAALRRALEQWFDLRKIRPVTVAEVDDSALVEVLGEAGLGVFAGPDVSERDTMERYGVVRIGHVENLPQRFYAIFPWPRRGKRFRSS